ncbi:hypothetical protein HN011_001530 [Eciton burchellii]|nr:hypothetical protein HN011_001530 [Eciton burchellii]
MHVIEDQYEILRIFLKMLGLWPYNKSCFTVIHKLLFAGILSTFIIVQLLAFLTMQFNTNLFLRIMSFLFPPLFATVKYCIFVIKADKVKRLLECIRDDLYLLQDKLEIDIMKRYAENIRFMTLFSIVFCHIGLFCYLILKFLPLMLDIFIPLNTSRSLKQITITEYFINRERYISVMLFHEVLTIYIGSLTICSTGSTIMMYFLHECALFKVASYRMENAIQKTVLAMPNPIKEYLFHQKIVQVVFIHHRIIRFYELMISSFFVMPYAFLIIIGVTSLSLNLVQLFQFITIMYDKAEISMILMLIILHINYMFVLNYGGEEIQKHGMQLSTATYNALWYAAPLRTQKLILFIMQRTSLKVTLTCGNIYVASLEGFLSLVNAAVSYFTVIYATR